MENLGIVSVLIPLFIIIMAIITKDVVVSLLSGIFLGELVVHQFQPLTTTLVMLDGFVALFAEEWRTQTIIYALLVGAIIKLISDVGGVQGFVGYLDRKYKNLDSPKGSLVLAYILGVVIFVESSITALVAGTVAKPVCDKNGVSREKLAFVCDSTSAPISSIIVFNAWGALLLGLIMTAINSSVIEGEAISLLIESIVFNFYSIISIFIVLAVILFNINIGPMAHAKAHKIEKQNFSTEHTSKSPLLMILPIIVLIAMVPVSLYYTGNGDILKGSGTTSVFYAVITTLVFMYFYYVPARQLKHKAYFQSLYAGISDMIPIVLILLLAFMIGNVIKDLGTANYLAELLNGKISPILLPLLVFLVAALTSFSTGTSWGTFAIMMPIALALAATFDIYIPIMIGAVISGGVFGDHVSPISDTTIISSMASGCDHIAHVRTQMPYALISAGLASVLYLIMGWVLV
jgi:tetracycline resistance efflux pump